MNILDLIGNTPLFNIDNIYIKLEMFNPSGSIKDRVVKEMIQPYLNNEHTFVEATSGNTGISLAMVCAVFNKRCIIFCPRHTSWVKIRMMRDYGAELYFMDTIQQCIDEAKSCELKYCYLNQFENPDNIKAQEKMAHEARYGAGRTIDGDSLSYVKHPDAIITGVGTGGTLMGLHNIFPNAKIYEVVPVGDRPIEGICDNVKTFVPDDLEQPKINVTYSNAKNFSNVLMRRHGVSCGLSSGANFYVANLIKNKYKKILTVFPDNYIRYL